MVELEVDTESGKVKVLKMTTAVDAGPVINPQNLTGQLEGGMDMGVGFALREEYVAGKTKDWVTFKFPTIRDTFRNGDHHPRDPAAQGAAGGHRRRRDVHGAHRAGGDQRHQQRRRGVDLRSAGHPGKDQGGAWIGGSK